MTSSPEPATVDVLGIPLFAGDIPKGAGFLVRGCQSNTRRNYCVSATGAHGLVMAQKDKLFEETLKNFYLNLPDGMPGVWVGRMKGARRMRRCYGPSFFQYMIENSRDMPVKHFFCGGNTGVADELAVAAREKFKNQNIVGTYCPPFLDVNRYDYDAIARVINSTDANIVWIGLSTPKQELFASNLSRRTNVNFIIAVGAAFDFHTGKVRQAPGILQQLGLEWLFRLLVEPRRLYKRYFEIVPAFIYYNFKELFTFATLKK